MANQAALSKAFKGKTILVTGGCGSIGSEIVRQVLEFDPEEVRIFDHSEDSHFRLSQNLQSERITHLIGDIRDLERVVMAMEGVDIVFHAAALKHVPYCEYNPYEAVNTNVIGTKNLVDAAIKQHIGTFISISTDKAVNPINTMGAAKLLSEKIVTNAPLGKSKVKFCCVRFGNVLASSGSIIPIFQQQIEEGDTITITHPDMTRFFMCMEEAVALVLRAVLHVENGEIFILKMPALKITDLAAVVVEELAPQCGKDPKQIKQQIIGIRPGEKLHEALMSEEEAAYMTELKDMLVLHNSTLSHFGMNGATRRSEKVQLKDYNSDTVPHLSKEDIRKTLKDNKVL